MIHLMKLELKKQPFRRYVLTSAAAILLSMYFIFIALNDTSSSANTFASTFRVVQLIFAFVYVIFFAVLVSAMVISEYNNGTILLLFTYPIDRRKIILAKLFVITLFIAASIAVGYLCCSLFILGIDRQFDLIDGTFSLDILKSWVCAALSSTLVFCCLGLWSFAVGMIKKSVSATIVSSVLFIYLRQFVVAASENYQENVWVVLAVLALSFLALRYTFAKKILQLD